jgi:hypothetical protein
VICFFAQRLATHRKRFLRRPNRPTRHAVVSPALGHPLVISPCSSVRPAR